MTTMDVKQVNYCKPCARFVSDLDVDQCVMRKKRRYDLYAAVLRETQQAVWFGLGVWPPGSTKPGSGMRRRKSEECSKARRLPFRDLTIFLQKIKRLGRDAFEWRLLHSECNCYVEAHSIELWLADKFKTFYPDGLNTRKD
jgi:hypothetical protein